MAKIIAILVILFVGMSAEAFGREAYLNDDAPACINEYYLAGARRMANEHHYDSVRMLIFMGVCTILKKGTHVYIGDVSGNMVTLSPAGSDEEYVVPVERIELR